MEDILPYFIGALPSSVLLVYLFVQVLKHPEKVEKWAMIAYRVLNFLFHRSERELTKFHIQSSINTFVADLEQKTDTEFSRIKLRWADPDEKEELIWADLEPILVVKKYKDHNRNIANAALLYTSESLLHDTKRHLSKTQSKALDLFTTLKILQEENIFVVKQYMKDFVTPDLNSNRDLSGLFNKLITIDKKGLYFPLLFKELEHLATKVFVPKPGSEIIVEVKNLIDFLERFCEREIGDDTVPDTYIGNFTKCSIRIVAAWQTVEAGKTEGHRRRIVESIARGSENIYVLGKDSPENVAYVDKIIDLVLVGRDQLSVVSKKTFKGQIKINGTLVVAKTYLVHLHNTWGAKNVFQIKAGNVVPNPISEDERNGDTKAQT